MHFKLCLPSESDIPFPTTIERPTNISNVHSNECAINKVDQEFLIRKDEDVLLTKGVFDIL